MASLFRPYLYKKMGGKSVCIGRGNWTIKFIQDGVERSESTGTKIRKDANDYFRNWNGKAKSKASVSKVEELILNDLEVNQYAPKTIEIYKTVFKSLRAIGKPLSEWGVPEVNQFKRLHKISHSAVNIYLRTLKAIFNKAKSYKVLTEIPVITLLPVTTDKLNPASGVLEPIQKTYSKEQFIALLKYLWNDGQLIKRKANEFGFDTLKQQHLLLEFCLIAFYTGCRRNEILNICIGHINISEMVIPIVQYKKRGKHRVKIIPIHPYLFDKVIKGKLQHDPLSRLCDLKPNYVTHKIKQVNRLLGFPDLKMHSIRHTYATELMRLDVNRYKIKDLLGHSAVSTSEIYVHTDTALLQESNAKLPVLDY